MDYPVAQRVLVIGGGVAGPVVALLLKQKGWQPILLEKVRHVGEAGLALVVQSNGLKVLNKAGVVDIALEGTPPWKFWNDWSFTGDFLGGPGSAAPGEFIDRYGWPGVGVSRTKLQLGLKRAVEDQGIPFIEGWKLKGIRVGQDSVTAVAEDGREVEAAFVIGCDGLKSATREVIFARQEVTDRSPSYTGILVTGGISPSPPFLKQRPGINLFWGPTETVITHPLNDEWHLWGGTIPVDDQVPESWRAVPDSQLEATKEQYLSRWKDWHPVVHELVSTATKIQNIGVFERGTLDIEHWYDDRMVLIGDAAHPTTPHIGQGANQCLEDAWTLYDAIPAFDTSHLLSTEELKTVFRSVANKRQASTTAVMREALKQGENRVLRGDRATAEGQRARDEMLVRKWNDVEGVQKEFDTLLSKPFDDQGGYYKWLEAKAAKGSN